MDGALMEIGPYRLKDDAHLVYNEGSWDEFANLLFIDNPVGTGFSYVDTDSYVRELKTMADQLIIFLEKFFELFPEHEDNDVSQLALHKGLMAKSGTDLHQRRIIRRAAHSILSPSNP
jgi:carboxypeptidase C (cathepsin A)